MIVEREDGRAMKQRGLVVGVRCGARHAVEEA
jgi:hypothetical protein